MIALTFLRRLSFNLLLPTALTLSMMGCTSGLIQQSVTEAESVTGTRLQCVRDSGRTFFLAPFVPPHSIGGRSTTLATCEQLIQSANSRENVVCALHDDGFSPTYFEVDPGKDLHQAQIGEGLSLAQCQSITTMAVDGFTCAKSNRKFVIHTIEQTPRHVDAGSPTLQACLDKLAR